MKQELKNLAEKFKINTKSKSIQPYYFQYKFLKQIYVLCLFLIKIESNLLLLKDDNT